MSTVRPSTKCLLFVLVIAIPAAAGVSWKDKPYTKWTAKDVRKILRNSPWAKIVGTPYYPEGESGGPPEVTTTVPIMGRVPDDPAALSPPGPMKEVYEPQGAYVVLWASSETVQHAVVRASVLNVNVPAQGTESSTEASGDKYELVLASGNPSPLPWMDHDAVMDSAYLEAMGSRQRVSPTRIEIVRDAKSSINRSVVFYFPKRTAAEKPLISPDETAVEFFVQLGPRTLLAKFNLREMAGPDGPDF